MWKREIRADRHDCWTIALLLLINMGACACCLLVLVLAAQWIRLRTLNQFLISISRILFESAVIHSTDEMRSHASLCSAHTIRVLVQM